MIFGPLNPHLFQVGTGRTAADPPPAKDPIPVPIVSFVGRSNSGKTTLIERLIPELVVAGHRVATIKHAGHGFDLDTEGKDSWRHKRAGASTVIVVSKGSLAMFSDVSSEVKVEEIRDRFLDK